MSYQYLPVLPVIPGRETKPELPAIPVERNLPPLPNWLTNEKTKGDAYSSGHLKWALDNNPIKRDWLQLDAKISDTKRKLLERELRSAANELKECVRKMPQATQVELLKQCRDKRLLDIVTAAIES